MKLLTIRSLLVALLVIAGLLTVAPAAAQEVTLQVREDATLGQILTDAEGNTLYRFTNDEPGTSNCVDACAGNWPPLLVGEGATPVAGDGVTGTIGTITRPDGTTQVTYNDMPLYFFVNDAAPGDTNGQSVRDIWYVVNPDAPQVLVNDQPIANDSVTIERVVVAEPGWLVVHADAEGRPGPILGQTLLTPGVNTGVVVQIDVSGATPTLFAMLHSDRGELGTFEFPGGADIPVTLNGAVVTPPFTVTGGLPEAAPDPAPEPTAAPAPAPEPTPVPPTRLPTTSAASTLPIGALTAFGLLLVVAGAGLSMLRRR